MSTTGSTPPRFRVGDWVTFHYGAQRALAQVVEDRGPLGVNRRRLYRVRLRPDPDESFGFEMPEEEMEPAPPPLDKAAVLRYLREGGLVAILSANLAGGRDQPRAWLTLNPRGEVMHTFSPDNGLIGGATVPFFALHDGRVFTAKKEDVRSLLRTFGLTQEEARAVIRAVGTAP